MGGLFADAADMYKHKLMAGQVTLPFNILLLLVDNFKESKEVINGC